MKKLLLLAWLSTAWLLPASGEAMAAMPVPAPALAASSPYFEASDPAVRPQDDLFLAVNGGWLRRTPIPADKSSYGVYDVLTDRADGRVRALVEELAQGSPAEGSDEQKIARFYRAFTDLKAIDEAGTLGLAPDLARIAAVTDVASLARLLGEWQGRVSLPIGLDVQPDAKQPDRYLAVAWQSGLGLPNRDYYLSHDPRLSQARRAYATYLETLFRLHGQPNPAQCAAEVIALETRLARGQWPEVDLGDPIKSWHPMTVAALAAMAPGLAWPGVFDAAAMPGLVRLNVGQPTYVRALTRAVQQVPLGTWRRYLQARLFDASVAVLPEPWRQAHFAFHGVALGGTTEPKPRWQQATASLDVAMGQAVGRLYVQRYFSPEHKARIVQLVNQLMLAFGHAIDEAEWLTPATRARAREKLAKYSVKVGYPDVWRDYSRLEIRDGDPLGNARRAARFEYERVAAHLGQPVDRTEWGMTPQTVNAYYEPAKNEIVFPAAILEPPLFDVHADDAENYGDIGATIGHEISHGFDDAGRRYDGDGRLRNWWTARDAHAFERLTARLVRQFNAYEALPGQRINGRLTLGENIADLSGLQVAYKAWKLSLQGREPPVIDGLTGEQRFFYAYALSWRGQARDEATLRQVTTDPHAPDRFRANGSVVNLDAFHSAFGTQPGDRMHRLAAERIRIW